MSFITDFLFKDTRRRMDRRARRHAFRDAENAIADVKARQEELEKESKKQWEAARTALKNGEKAAATRALTSARAAQAMSLKLEQKRWVFEQYLTKMQVAESDNQFASALGALNAVVKIDPDRVEDVFAAANEALGDQVDSDKFWNAQYEKEMAGASGEGRDGLPSMEDLQSQLEQEVAAEIGGAAGPQAAEAALTARISAGQQRVKDLLAGK